MVLTLSAELHDQLREESIRIGSTIVALARTLVASGLAGLSK